MTEPDDQRPQPPFVLVEHPRSYREVAFVFAAVCVGFAVDLALGGAVAHLPGWIGAAVVLCGVWALFVGSTRSTRTLVVTADDVWVGEERIARAQLRSVHPAYDRRSSAPVLGWPTGRTGRFDGVTLQLASGSDVIVPARDPARLADVLGIASTEAPLPGVRPATADDLPHLPDIDRRAEVVFRLAGHDLPRLEWTPPADPVATFVAGSPPVGFALLTEVDGNAHLEEIAVLPGSMRRGTGGALLEHACRWAADAGYPAMTLCTYADVPWNGPWYAARGFVSFAAPTPGLASLRERERQLGLDAVGPRVVMRREL